jgi:colanic acid/amylovoran biosynthesis glycosyltransferase
VKKGADFVRWQRELNALNPRVLAYVFERFPKFSQTFCYREVVELFRQGEKPAIFSLRSPDLGPEASWDNEIVKVVHVLPEGDEFAKAVDAESHKLPKPVRKILRQWRGKRDSLRLHQAAYIGVRLRELGVTHVHTHFAGMAARTAFWIREFFGITYSVTVHANDVFTPNDFEVGLDKIFSSASAIVAVSNFGADYIREKFSEAAKRVYRVYNGIDVEQFQPAKFDQPPLVLSIGRLISKKGFDILIEACAILRESGLDFQCEVIGEGPLQRELQERIDQHHLADCVTLSGPKPQRAIAGRLAEATVLTLPCRIDPDGAMDNLPTVIMEAMAAALPVVTTDVGGVHEMVTDGENGFVVELEDTSAIAEATKRLLTDRTFAQRFGQRGRQRAIDLFSISRNVRELREIIS